MPLAGRLRRRELGEVARVGDVREPDMGDVALRLGFGHVGVLRRGGLDGAGDGPARVGVEARAGVAHLREPAAALGPRLVAHASVTPPERV